MVMGHIFVLHRLNAIRTGGFARETCYFTGKDIFWATPIFYSRLPIALAWDGMEYL